MWITNGGIANWWVYNNLYLNITTIDIIKWDTKNWSKSTFSVAYNFEKVFKKN